MDRDAIETIIDAFAVICDKGVNIVRFNQFRSARDYNFGLLGMYELTEEEFTLIKKAVDIIYE